MLFQLDAPRHEQVCTTLTWEMVYRLRSAIKIVVEVVNVAMLNTFAVGIFKVVICGCEIHVLKYSNIQSVSNKHSY